MLRHYTMLYPCHHGHPWYRTHDYCWSEKSCTQLTSFSEPGKKGMIFHDLPHSPAGTGFLPSTLLPWLHRSLALAMLHKLFQTSLDQRGLEPAFCMNQPPLMMKPLNLIFPTKDESKESLTVKHWVSEITHFAGRIVWHIKLRTFGLQNDWHHPGLIGIATGTLGGTKSENATDLYNILELQEESYLPYLHYLTYTIPK